MKLALEALEELITDVRMCDDIERGERAITALREALAEPQPEPVAWRVKWPAIGGGHKWLMVDRPLMEKEGFVNEALYTSPPAQEFVCSTGLCHYRKPLTDEQIETVWRSVQANDFHDCVKPFARDIEAAHQIGVEK